MPAVCCGMALCCEWLAAHAVPPGNQARPPTCGSAKPESVIAFHRLVVWSGLGNVKQAGCGCEGWAMGLGWVRRCRVRQDGWARLPAALSVKHALLSMQGPSLAHCCICSRVWRLVALSAVVLCCVLPCSACVLPWLPLLGLALPVASGTACVACPALGVVLCWASSSVCCSFCRDRSASTFTCHAHRCRHAWAWVMSLCAVCLTVCG